MRAPPEHISEENFQKPWNGLCVRSKARRADETSARIQKARTVSSPKGAKITMHHDQNSNHDDEDMDTKPDWFKSEDGQVSNKIA